MAVKTKKLVQVRFLRSTNYQRTIYNGPVKMGRETNPADLAVFDEETAHKLTERRVAKDGSDMTSAEWVGTVVDGQIIPGPRPEKVDAVA